MLASNAMLSSGHLFFNLQHHQARASRRSPERGAQSTTSRDGSYRRRAGSPGRDDSRGRPASARDGRHSKSGGGSASGSHTSMGVGSMGMGMGVSIIGGTPVLMPVAKMMEAAAVVATSRGGGGVDGGGGGGGDRQSGRHGGLSSRWGGGGRDEVEDRWAGDLHSEDGRDHHHRGGVMGRSEDQHQHQHHQRRRRDSVGSGSRRSRADSRDATQTTLGQASSPPQEEEPEEGELVIESSSSAVVLPTTVGSPSPPRRGKSRWGNVEEGALSPLLGEASGGHGASRGRDSRSSRDRGQGSIGDEAASRRRDDGYGKITGVTKGTCFACVPCVLSRAHTATSIRV